MNVNGLPSSAGTLSLSTVHLAGLQLPSDSYRSPVPVRVLSLFVLACSVSLTAFGQGSPPNEQSNAAVSEQDANVKSGTDSHPDHKRSVREELLAHIDKLNSSSYRAREMAVWHIRRHPQDAIPLISERLANSDFHSSAAMIELLSYFATSADDALGLEAQRVLESTAESGTSAVARLAKGSVQSIANLQEAKSTELLTHLGMTIGFPELLVNGAKINYADSEAVYTAWVNQEFVGSPDDMLRMQFLQHVKLVYLQGISVNEKLMRAVCQMPNVKSLVLREVKLSPDVLLMMSQMRNFDHFEMSYVDIGDDAIDILESLPVWSSMRFFGTKLSRASADRLKTKYTGLAFYFGKGGYLGVGTGPLNSTVVQSVQPGSGAEKAGIIQGDRLTHVGKNPIKTFEELRAELSYFGAGESVEIGFLRKGNQDRITVELTEMPASSLR